MTTNHKKSTLYDSESSVSESLEYENKIKNMKIKLRIRKKKYIIKKKYKIV